MSSVKEGWSQRPLAGETTDASESKGRDEQSRNRPSDPPREPAGSDGFVPVTAYLEQLGPGSRRTMREALTKLAGWASDGRAGPHELPWHLLRIEHTAALRTRLASQLAPATANKHLAALRGVLKQAWRNGDMSAEAYQRAIDLPPVRGESPRKTKRLGTRELHELVRVCAGDTSPAGARDEALLALLYGASLRRSEAVALDLDDYDPDRGALRIRSAGPRATRRVTATDPARRALERWLLIRGPEPGPLFNPVNKGGRIEHRRLSEQAIYIACQKRAAEAGLPPTSPEDLRRAAPESGTSSPGTNATPA